MAALKMTKDEIIDSIIEEWWESLDEKAQAVLIDEYCQDVGIEIIEEEND